MLDKRCLAPHALRHYAQAAGARVALQHVDGTSLTYAQLDVDARTWAGGFRRLGVDHGIHVGTLLTNRFEAHRTMVALGWLRAIEVPLNTAYIGKMLHYALDLADVTVLVTETQFVSRVAEAAADLPLLRTVVVIDSEDPSHQWLHATGSSGPEIAARLVGIGELLDGAAVVHDLPGPSDHDVACLMFTSGTTGPSKAVIIAVGCCVQNWTWVPEDIIDEGDGLYCAMPLFHNSGRGAFNFALVNGAALRPPRQVQRVVVLGRHQGARLRAPRRPLGR